MALKEWGVVCRALDAGRQAISLRKGGIHEPRDGFRVEHREFWLFPTKFHEGPESLRPDAAPLLNAELSEAAAGTSCAGKIRIANYVVVDDVRQITDSAQAQRLAALTIWSNATILGRFNYRTPGLFLLLMRVYRAAQPCFVAESPELAGCHSWVELPEALATESLLPVLSDEQFARARQSLDEALAG
jgi:hypothetical protein